VIVNRTGERQHCGLDSTAVDVDGGSTHVRVDIEATSVLSCRSDSSRSEIGLVVA
jgi:hypothetical protein